MPRVLIYGESGFWPVFEQTGRLAMCALVALNKGYFVVIRPFACER